MTRPRLTAALAAAFLVSGCATMMISSHKSLSLRTLPDGARFEVREADAPERIVSEGTTPFPLRLARGTGYFSPARYSIAVSKDGYAPRTIDLPTRVSGWYWMNLPMFALGGVFGLTIFDPFDGAMWEIDAPEAIELQPLAAKD